MARLKQENALTTQLTETVDPTKPLSAEQASYLQYIIMHLGNVFITNGYYRLKKGDDYIRVTLTHALLKYRQESNPEIVRCEVLDNNPCQSGTFGLVIRSLLVIIIENNKLTIKTRNEDKKRAVKMIDFEQTSKEEIEQEAYMIQKSESRLRCKLPFFDESYGYLIMTYIEGITLDELICQLNKKEIKLEYMDLLYIMLSAAKAVQHLHHHGILHLDIKGLNLIVDAQKCLVTACDLGIACKAKETYTNSPRGTPGFAAPELVLESKISKKADVFSLGILFTQLLGVDDNSILNAQESTCDGNKFHFFVAKQRDEKLKKFSHNRPIPEDNNTQGLLETMLHAMTRFDKAKRTNLPPVIQSINLLIALERQRLLIKHSYANLLPVKDTIIPCKKYPHTTLRSAIGKMQELIEFEKKCWEKEQDSETAWDLSPRV